MGDLSGRDAIDDCLPFAGDDQTANWQLPAHQPELNVQAILPRLL
jgi:hypothetical protein